MAPRQQIMMTTETLDGMRLCFKTKVRFSYALLVLHSARLTGREVASLSERSDPSQNAQ